MLAIELELEAELDVQLLLVFEAGVSVPQSGKRLANQTYGVLNHTGSYFMSDGGDSPFNILT